jgi:uncharacterized membrane protein YfcA
MAPTAWLLLLCCAFGAEVIGTMAGFGAATILTPVATLFMDVKTAIAVVACFHLFGNASRLAFFGRHVQWRTGALFGLSGVACSFIGAAVTARLSSALVALLLGAFLLAYVALSLWASDRLRWPRRPATLLAAGAVSGLIAGLIGTGGAIRAACLLAFGLPPAAYVGTSAAIALAVDAIRLPVYLAERLIPSALVPVVGSLIPTALAGAWVGRRLIHRLSTIMFRRVVLAMLTVIGAKLILDGWHGLAP